MLRHHERVFTTECPENTEGMRRKQFQNYNIAFLRCPSVFSVHSVVNTRVQRNASSDSSTRVGFARKSETLEVVAQKLRADGVGLETATPMNDLLEVGVFAGG
jgi:hypothetical protein